jgi:hypothetical protein
VRAAIVPIALIALLPAACGSGERRFDAESAVAELNRAGAGLELGAALSSTEEGVEVRSVDFVEESEHPEEDEHSDGDEHVAEEDGHAHDGAGAVVILDDATSAEAEFERCGTTVSFICFRVANAVLRFTELDEAERARLTAAVSALQTEPS